MPGRGSLTIVGTGIRVAGQLTLEALDQIRRAETFLYLAGDLATAHWLRALNPAAEGLADAYAEGRPRAATYRDMTRRILAPVRGGRRVVVAFYGHPGVGVDPAHAALRRARAEGYAARMLPGISAEACLVADLGVDPLDRGWQSHEAWAFVQNRPMFDPRSPLLLWQLGLVYQPSIDFSGTVNRRGVRAVASALRRDYPALHEAVLYEASPFPVCGPRIERVRLSELPRARVEIGTSLYVPPIGP